jgi:hypothetical protein
MTMDAALGCSLAQLRGPMWVAILVGAAALAACHVGKHGRRRHGRFHWWWIPVIVMIALWIKTSHHNRRFVRQTDEQQDRIHTPIAMSPRQPVIVDGRIVPALEVDLDTRRCQQKGVAPRDVGVAVLTVIDELSRWTDEAGERSEPRDLEKLLVPAGNDRTVELGNIARLSWRQPLPHVQAPIEALRVVAAGEDRAAFIDELQTSLNEAARYREQERLPGHAFQVMGIAHDHFSSSVIVRLPKRDVLLAGAKPDQKLDEPPLPPNSEKGDPPAPPAGELRPAAEPVAERASPGLVDRLVELALSWTSASDRGEIKSAIEQAKREAAAEAAKVLADAVAAHAQTRAEANPTSAPSAPTESDASTRPAWVDATPVQRFDGGKFIITGSTGPFYATRQESLRALPDVVKDLKQTYVELVFGPETAKQIDVELIPKSPVTWTGPVKDSSGLTYYETYAMLEFTEQDHRQLVRLLRELATYGRARQAGIVGGAVLLLLATLLGYLKLDTATKGYYSGRLKLAAGTISLALVTLVVLIFAGQMRM